MRMAGMGTFCAALAVFALAVPCGVVAAEDDVAIRIDEYLTKLYPADQPGAAVIVTRDGEVLFRKGYGLASVELGVPIDAGMVFEIGSMTKQFTAVAVMMLVESGDVGLDDEVSKHLPDYDTGGKAITIRHLLTHTSGVPDLTDMEEWAKRRRERLTPDEEIAFFSGKPLDFEPGEEHRYSNSNYILLGRVVEVASGMPWSQFIGERIVGPLGMEHTGVDDGIEIVPGLVGSYKKSEGKLVHPDLIDMSQPWAAGALYSNVDDLAKWDAALYTDALLSGASVEQCFTPAVLNNGQASDYGFGWAIEEFKGRKLIWHNGRVNGYLSHALRLPDERLYVAVLSNLEDSNATPGRVIAESVAAIAIGEPFEEAAGIELGEEELSAYVGTYRGESGGELQVVAEEGKLFIVIPGRVKDEIVPQSRTEFFVPKRRVEIGFELGEDGTVLRLLVPGPGESKIAFEKVE